MPSGKQTVCLFSLLVCTKSKKLHTASCLVTCRSRSSCDARLSTADKSSTLTSHHSLHRLADTCSRLQRSHPSHSAFIRLYLYSHQSQLIHTGVMQTQTWQSTGKMKKQERRRAEHIKGKTNHYHIHKERLSSKSCDECASSFTDKRREHSTSCQFLHIRYRRCIVLV